MIDEKYANKSLKVDLTFETELTPDVSYGIKSTESVKELCTQTNNLIANVILFKKLLHKHDLDKPYFGGINSYIVTILTAAFLRSFGETAIRKSFISMLDYYGNIFDPKHVAIIGGYLVSVENTQGGLFISDPYRPHINIAQSVTRFNKIQTCFTQCHKYLMQTRRTWYYEYYEGCQILNNILN